MRDKLGFLCPKLKTGGQRYVDWIGIELQFQQSIINIRVRQCYQCQCQPAKLESERDGPYRQVSATLGPNTSTQSSKTQIRNKPFYREKKNACFADPAGYGTQNSLQPPVVQGTTILSSSGQHGKSYSRIQECGTFNALLLVAERNIFSGT
jgi:hypothetical protein